MGHRTDWLALAGTSRVSGYTRKSSSGKTVHVDAYTRSVKDMSLSELRDEYHRLKNSTSSGDRNRLNSVLSELRTSFPTSSRELRAVAEKRLGSSSEAEKGGSALDKVKRAAGATLDTVTGVGARRKADMQRLDSAMENLQSAYSSKPKPGSDPAAAAAAIKKAGSLDGVGNLSDSELEAIVKATKWGEEGDEWGERAQDILAKRKKG